MESKSDNSSVQPSPGDAPNEGNSARDTIESIWVAIIFAFVLRAFMVEAFVIPTGSMAPQLMGEHWHVRCPSCGYEYDYGASGQEDYESQGRSPAGPAGAKCPNCGMYIPPDMAKNASISGGDRVLVLKYIYEFEQPKPWDVVVFKNPQNNRENYIKRLIGLPGESIQIVHGDIFYSDSGPEGTWKIRRKTPAAQSVMWQNLFNNDYRASSKIRGAAVQPQWQIDGEGMVSRAGGREFFADGSKDGTIKLQATRELFLPYNAYNNSNQDVSSENDLCGDLKLSCVFSPSATGASMTMSMTSYYNTFRATVYADGSLKLSGDVSIMDQKKHWTKSGKTDAFRPGTGKRIELAHVDMEASLWIDGVRVLTSDDEQYAGFDPISVAKDMEHIQSSTPEISISTSGKGLLSHLVLARDVYYVAARVDAIDSDAKGDLARSMGLSPRSSKGWGTSGNPITLARHPENSELDEFFVLGDNSPCSLDGRSWTSAAMTLRLKDEDGRQAYHLGTVPRYNLLGRAFFVYWPAGFPIPIRNLPIIPDVGKMRLIR